MLQDESIAIQLKSCKAIYFILEHLCMSREIVINNNLNMVLYIIYLFINY